MALEPITRQEKIIAGQDLAPITRMEKFLKQYGGGSGGATSWNDLTDKPFDENGAIMPEALPEGYPYKEKGATILDVTHEFPMLRQQQFPAENGGLEEGKVYTVTITDPNGNVTKKVETADNASGGIGFQVVYNEYSYALTIRYRAEGNVYNITDSGDGGQFTITIEAPETIHPMAPEFLPRMTAKVTINEDDMSATSDMTYAEINALVNSGSIKVELSTPLGVHVLNYCGCDGDGTLSFCTPWMLDPYNSTGIDVFFVNISSDDSIDFKWFKATGTW